jgi:hypothetical protein
VEWNPNPDRPSLREAVRWPRERGALTVRLIQVPASVHARYPNSENIGLFEFIAKNVGVRRASGRHVLVTSPDIVLDTPLWEHLMSSDLREQALYRVDRYDVDALVPPGGGLDDILRFCDAHTRSVCAQNGFIPTGHSCIRAGRATLAAALVGHVLGLRRRARRLARQAIGPILDPLRRIHTYASGDFVLLSRDLWWRIRGHPEWTTHNHVDSLTCYLAISAGAKQRVLPYRIYHQYQDRSDAVARPQTRLRKVEAIGRASIRAGTPQLDNSPDWGLASETFPEFEV